MSFAIVSFLALALGAPASWAQDTPAKKAKREKILDDLDKEAGKLVPLVKDIDKASPCGTSPAAAKASPKPGPKFRVRGAPSGAPFCPDKFLPIKEKMKKMIDEADSLNYGDERAGQVKSFWHQYLESFGTELGYLADMKAKHHVRDAPAKQCKTISEGMLARARAAVNNKSLDEFEAARSEAAKDRTTVTSLLSTEASTKNSMEQWRRNTETFKPERKWDNAWKPVYQALHASSKKMDDQWLAAYQNTTKECAEPAKGEEHAGHRALEDELFAALKKQLEDDLDKWKGEAGKVFRYDCESMKKLHEAYCLKLDGDEDEEHDLAAYDKQADEMKGQIGPNLDAREAELGDFRTRSYQLESRRNGRMGSVEAFKGWQQELAAYRKLLDEQKPGLEDLRDHGVLRGSRNPKRQLWIEFGKQRHEAMEKEPKYACTLADVSFCWEREADGSCKTWRRPDCVSAGQCKIWEFKPESPAAKQKGEKQLKDYKAMVEKHYNFALNLHRSDNLNFTPVGGSDVMLELDEKCAKGGTLNLVTEVSQYPRCTKDIEYTCPPEPK